MLKPATAERASRPKVAGPQERSAGSLLRARRKSYGLTQEDLATQVGCSVSHVKRVERGEANPSPRARALFAEVLFADPGELFADFPPPRAEREQTAIAERRAYVEKRRAEGATIPEISRELGLEHWATVGRDVQALGLETRMGPAPKYPPPPAGLVCGHCGKPLPYRSPSYGARPFCDSECFLAHVKTGEVVKCPGCGKKRYRPASHARKVQCVSCRMKGWSSAGRQRWGNRYAKAIAAARGKKVGRRLQDSDALRVAKAEQELLARGLDAAQVVDVLILNFRGRDAVWLPSGNRRVKRDVRYRAARQWVERRLRDGRPLLRA
jgi:transcriptional regulator with XRE-family HTH domain